MAERQTARLLEVFERNHERLLIIDARDGTRLTYGEMLRNSRVLASWLADQGVQKGEAVAFSMENCTELAQLYFACLHLGARVVPINPTFHPHDFARTLERTSARCFVTAPAVRLRLEDCLRQQPQLKVLCVAPAVEHLKGNQAALVNVDLRAELARHAPASRSFADAGDDDICFTMFSSGSTGTPKGINIRYGGLLGNGLAFCRRLGLGAENRFYNVLSMTYLGGLYNLMLIPILAEGSLLLDAVFGPANMYAFWERVRAHGVNTLWFSATILSMLLSADDGEDLSFLKEQIRIGLCGMAPLPVDLKRRFEQKFGFTLYENYGLSETTFVTTNAPDLAYKPGSVGLPVDGVTVQIAGPDMQPLEPGRAGQVLVKTPYLMAGYDQLESPEDVRVLPTGFFLTGDMGHLEENGELVITGRIKDIIIRGGVNISPKAIEDVIYRLDDVQEAAVVGAPHPVYGEEVALVIKLRDSRQTALSVQDVRKFCEANIANFQRPKHIFFIDEMPRGATGKTQKSVLRRLLTERLDPLAG